MLNVQEIRELIQLIDDSSIQEFTYEEDGASVKMKKAVETYAVAPAASDVQAKSQNVVPQQPVTDAPEEQPPVESTAETPEKEKNQTDYDYEITSPMVGTLYSAATPENGPYVHIGSKVEEDTVVCMVEAMKLFNEIEAEVSGEIVEILVEDGELVEYGQPLFRVKTK